MRTSNVPLEPYKSQIRSVIFDDLLVGFVVYVVLEAFAAVEAYVVLGVFVAVGEFAIGSGIRVYNGSN